MMLRWLALCTAALAVAGCGRSDAGCNQSNVNNTASPRLISFSPAVTALLHDLALDRQLVGRSAFCRGVDALPVVGDLSGVDVEAVIRLKPDILLYQATAAPPPMGLIEAAKATHAKKASIGVDDIEDLHRAIDAVVDIVDESGTNQVLQSHQEAAHRALRKSTQPTILRTNVRVLLVQPGASMLAWGGETWLGHVVRAAGAQLVLDDRAWVTVSAEDVIRLVPDVIFVLGEQVNVDAGALSVLATPASEHNRVYVLHHPRLLIPGTHAVAVRALIDELLAQASDSARSASPSLVP
jgi:ABC-type hemin transport system substrate-binding protein